MKRAIYTALAALLLISGCKRDRTPITPPPPAPQYPGWVGAPHLRFHRVGVFADTVDVLPGTVIIIDSTIAGRGGK